ncbi:transcriptional regulator [Azospirillum tabaci]|uniref:transcriptional regulator n=1 Tax=Azospirillum tabaci TaxID=2752310 RepID=UPI001661706D|nr:transcriptional regulator [Azospirillum tabaci]
MALAAVKWGVRDLAAAANVSMDTIARFKRGERVKESTIDSMRTALEGAGVEFIPEGPYQGDGGAGARLRSITKTEQNKTVG